MGQTLNNVVLLPLDVKNANGRIYDQAAAEKILGDIAGKKIPMYGELGYPETFDISLSNVSHIVEIVRLENNRILGDIKILETPSGKILENSLPHYVFRPRSAGSIQENGIVDISKFFTFDAVRVEADSYNFASIGLDDELI